MASDGKDISQELHALSDKERRLKNRSAALDYERTEAQRMLAQVEEQRRSRAERGKDAP